MDLILILSAKGGAGKTTVARELAVAATMAGRQVALIDLDPQAGLTGVASRYVQKLVTRRGEVALGNVREGLPSWTTCSIPYPIENMCVSDDHRLTHSRTPW